MENLGVEGVRTAELLRDPFDHIVVPRFVSEQEEAAIIKTFPESAMKTGGVHLINETAISPPLQKLLSLLDSTAFENALSEKFDLKLSHFCKVFSLRGYCRNKDGKIHTDAPHRIITILLYLNGTWNHDGGQLRLLHSASDINDFALEISPDQGTLLAFRRTDNSYHGHEPFEGVRRSIQVYWTKSSPWKQSLEYYRHKVSGLIKPLFKAPGSHAKLEPDQLDDLLSQ